MHTNGTDDCLSMKRPLSLNISGRKSPAQHARHACKHAWRWGRCVSARSGVAYVLCDAAEHDKEGHPESAARFISVRDALSQLQSCAAGPAAVVHDQLYQLQSSRVADAAELELVHPAGYLQRLSNLAGSIEEPVMLDDSTYLAPGSMAASTEAVGATLDLLDHVLARNPFLGKSHASRVADVSKPHVDGEETADSSQPAHAAHDSSRGGRTCGFALVRPPGHHVLPSRPMGFGLINIVSAAARYAQRRHGLDRCLIFDFDVHHGNGTMEVFWADPSVLYVSVHQANLWPYTGKDTNRGAGAGLGATINVPLPGGAGDEAMCSVIRDVLWPAALRFKPDIIIASAGYDAHWRDPLAGLQLHSVTYRRIARQLTHMANCMCSGRLLLVLEGGYDAQALAEGVSATLRGLMQGQREARTWHASTGLLDEYSNALFEGGGTWVEADVGMAQNIGVQALQTNDLVPNGLQPEELQIQDAHGLWPGWLGDEEELDEAEHMDLEAPLAPEPLVKVQQSIQRVLRLHGL